MQLEKSTIVALVCGLLFACGDVDEEEDRTVAEFVLYSPDMPDKPLYKLNIDNEYPVEVLASGTLLVTTAYPGMVGFSEQTKSRFYNENETWAPDLIRIFLRILPLYEGGDLDETNRNDTGRFTLQNILRQPDIELIPTEDAIIFAELVEKYTRPQWRENRYTYVINHDDQRIAVVRCALEMYCTVNTTWNGGFSIRYQFSRHQLKNLVDLDNSIVSLIDKFNPTLFYNED